MSQRASPRQRNGSRLHCNGAELLAPRSIEAARGFQGTWRAPVWCSRPCACTVSSSRF